MILRGVHVHPTQSREATFFQATPSHRPLSFPSFPFLSLPFPPHSFQKIQLRVLGERCELPSRVPAANAFWRILGSRNASHGNILLFGVQCKWLCFVDLSSKKIIPQFISPKRFPGSILLPHVSMEWTPVTILLRWRRCSAGFVDRTWHRLTSTVDALRLSTDTSRQAPDARLELAVLGSVDERVDAAAGVHQYNARRNKISKVTRTLLMV